MSIANNLDICWNCQRPRDRSSPGVAPALIVPEGDSRSLRRSASKSTTLEDVTIEALVTLGLSLAGLISLAAWFGLRDEFGATQVYVLFALHVVAGVLLAIATAKRKANYLVLGLAVPLLWNVGALGYSMWQEASAQTFEVPGMGTFRTGPPNGQTVELWILVFFATRTMYRAFQVVSGGPSKGKHPTGRRGGRGRNSSPVDT